MSNGKRSWRLLVQVIISKFLLIFCERFQLCMWLLGLKTWVLYWTILNRFLSGFSSLKVERGKGGHLYSSLPLPSAREHSDNNLQLYMWDDYFVFLITPLVSSRLLRYYFLTFALPSWITVWLINDRMLANFCLPDDQILDFLTVILTQESRTELWRQSGQK